MTDWFAKAPVLWKLCGFFCHQLPDRSPQFDMAVFPLCFRCAGVYVGLLSSYLYLGLTGGYKRRLPELPCALTLTLLCIPFLLDVWSKPGGWWMSPGGIRALTGLGVGVTLPLLLVPLSHRDLLDPNPPIKPTLRQAPEIFGPLLLGCAVLWLINHPGNLFVFQLLALLTVAGPLIFLISFGVALGQIDFQMLRSGKRLEEGTGPRQE